jgi:hypothetical protein
LPGAQVRRVGFGYVYIDRKIIRADVRDYHKRTRRGRRFARSDIKLKHRAAVLDKFFFGKYLYLML